jgi:hypothetical protein
VRNFEATRSAFIDQSQVLEEIMADVADLGQSTRARPGSRRRSRFCTRARPNRCHGHRTVLDTLLEGPRPADLGDEVAWIEAATGRSIHKDERLPVFG